MTGKVAKRLARLVETRWLSLADALAIILAQWDALAAYFQAEANSGHADYHTIQQLADLFTPKNKILLTFISSRLNDLNILNKLFQQEQADQSVLLEHLLTFYFTSLEEIITEDGYRRAKNAADPLSFDFSPFRKEPSMIHFGYSNMFS